MNARFLGIPELASAGTPRTAVVVDVMRAFTTAAWAFERGAERIVLAGTLDEALALKAANPDWVALKDGPPAPGFDLVNSPGKLRDKDLAGRTVVQKTTAGTVGALAVKDAELVLCASFPVAGATAEVLREAGNGEVVYVVTGEDGRADEDRACAEYIAALVADADTNTDGDGDGGRVDPAGYVRRGAESRAAWELAAEVREGIHPDDVAMCLEVDRFGFAMEAAMEGQLLVLRARRAGS